MIRILVVEDEKAISDLIRLNLMKAGYQCLCIQWNESCRPVGNRKF